MTFVTFFSEIGPVAAPTTIEENMSVFAAFNIFSLFLPCAPSKIISGTQCFMFQNSMNLAGFEIVGKLIAAKVRYLPNYFIKIIVLK